MLNEKNERELAYVVTIAEIKPIPNYDRVEYARIGAGWWVIVKKDQFKVGDLAIYFEIDSKVPETEPFEFLAKRNYKVKTLKMCKVVSQGLLMSFEDFGWKGVDYKEGDFLTKKLGVVYATEEDNVRKAQSVDKYKQMMSRRQDIFKKKWARWLMKYKLGRKVMFLLFGSKRDKVSSWPHWVQKTDEERCQNMPWLFPGNGKKYIGTEKIDGTSTTFTMKRKKFGQYDYRVCSRNVCFAGANKDKKGYYDTNVYLEMSEKYHMGSVLKAFLNQYPELDFVTIQGETYGGTIQKRNYGDEHRLAAFNLIFGYKDGRKERFNPMDMTIKLEPFGVPCVPIVLTDFVLPETCDELLAIATGSSKIDGEMREGIVFRSYDGQESFKAVSNEFLLKYHQ